MLKLIIVLFNLIAFIVVTALLPADIKVQTSLPDQFVVDSTYVIEVTISKGEIFGFAKYQQNLPPGFEAKAVNTAEGSFTFADGKVKFIWMALPEANEVKISYAIKATGSAPAEGVIEGTFSYIEDNERKTYPIPNIPVKVVSESATAKPKIPITVNAARQVTALGNNEFEVTLSVTKQGIEGFAKLEEFLPEGAEAIVVNNNKAVFSQVNEKVKFVWMAMPAEETVSVSYKVKSASDILNELMSMEGSYSYLDDQQTKSIAITPPANAMVMTPPVATTPEPQPTQAPVQPAPEPVAVATAPPVQEAPVQVTPVAVNPEPTPAPVVAQKAQEPIAVEPVAQTAPAPKPAPKPAPAVAEKPKPAKPATIPTPETGISYKVQIVAGHVMVKEEYIASHFKFDEPVGIENHEGWIKYTTGGYPAYSEARNKREALVAAQHNFPGPFVTAYNSGVRITVQEALMISNQKWVK